MSDTRSLGINIGANTNSFTQGIAEVQARLTAYNRALLENREATRQNNAEIRNLERQQAAMRAAMQEAGEVTEEERQNLANLQNSLDAARDRAAELATQQATLRTQIRQTTTELVNASTAAQNATNRTEEQLTATERLLHTISEQQAELRRLEQQYNDIVLEEDNNSESAQNLRQQIERLSSELNENRERLEDATHRISENSDALDENSDAAENASEGFTILKGAISSLVADAIQKAIDKFKELMLAGDKALNKLQAQTGMTTAEISEFKNEMYDLYRNNYGGSLEDIAGTMSIVKQSFSDMSASQVEEITRKAIIMSDTFGSDVEETLRGVNALITHMGLTADEAFDYIAKGSQNGLDKTHELSDNLAEYTQIWAQAGFTANEMFSVLQNGIDSGAYSLDKVNDLVKEISISIIDGRLSDNINNFSNETKQAFYEFQDGKATVKDVFNSIIKDLNETTGLAEKLATSSNTWSSLGEDNAISIIEALNNVNDAYSNVVGTIDEIDSVIYDDLGNQLEAIGRMIEVDIIKPLAEGVMPTIKTIVESVSNNLPLVVSAFSAVTGAVLSYKAATTSAKIAQEGLNAVMDSNPIFLMISAAAALVSGLLTLDATMKAATETTDKYTEAIKFAKEAANDEIQSTEDMISKIAALNSVYDKLRTKTNLTATESSYLNTIAKQLAESLGLTTDEIKNQTGGYIDLNSQVESTIKNMRELAQYQAQMNVLTSAEEAKFSAGVELEQAKNELNEFYEANKAVLDNYFEYGELKLEDSGIYTQYTRLQENVKSLESSYQSACDTVDAYNQALDELVREQETSTQSTYKQTETLKEQKKTFEEQINIVAKSVKVYSEYKKSVEEAEDTVTDSLQNIADSQNLLKKATEEVEKNNQISLSTLLSLIKKYPELNDVVNDYIAGIKDEKAVIEELKTVYQNDVNSYKDSVKQKIILTSDFYDNLLKNNANFVNDCKEKYEIDLQNYANIEEAKTAIKASAEAKRRAELVKTAWVEENAPKVNIAAWNPLGVVSGNTSMMIDSQKSAEEKKRQAQFALIDKAAQDAGEQAAKEFQSFVDSYYSRTYTAYAGNSVDKSLTELGNTSSSSSSSNDTILKAYQDKLDLAYEAYNKLINDRIELIEAESDAAQKAADKKIALIDKEIEARKRLNEDTDRQAEIDAINAQLEYAQLDELSRRELERKKQDLLDEQAEVDWQREMSDKKEAIRNGLSATQEKNNEAMEALKAASESAKNYFDKLSGTQSNSQIVNNNSDTRNIQIIQNALNDQQMVDKLLKAIYDG